MAAHTQVSTGPGWVLGTPGGGLSASLSADRGWAVNDDVARAGLDGELWTASVLNGWADAPGGPTVLHDLAIPLPGVDRANIDHIVVSGRSVLIVDSKVWRAGWHWTVPDCWPVVGGRSYRGVRRFRLLDKPTMAMARTGISRRLAGSPATVHADVCLPVVAVWPSGTGGRLHVGGLRSPDAVIIPADRLARLRSRYRHPADRAIVEVLAGLLLGGSGSR